MNDNNIYHRMLQCACTHIIYPNVLALKAVKTNL